MSLLFKHIMIKHFIESALMLQGAHLGSRSWTLTGSIRLAVLPDASLISIPNLSSLAGLLKIQNSCSQV
jgi:hypothetical protein